MIRHDEVGRERARFVEWEPRVSGMLRVSSADWHEPAMTEEQKEFWQGVIMHFVISVFVAINAIPFLRGVPFWLIVAATTVGTTGGMYMATRAWDLHRTHRPSLVRGIAEGSAIGLVVYAIFRQLAERGPEIRQLSLVGVMLAIPAWFAAYAVYMLIETRGGVRQSSRN